MADDEVTTTADQAMAPSMVQRWQELAAAIPDAEGGDGDGALLNVPVRIVGVRKAPSDYAHGPGFYLILDLVDLETGEKMAATTGAVGVMAQIVKAAAAGWIPLSVVLREAQRP